MCTFLSIRMKFNFYTSKIYLNIKLKFYIFSDTISKLNIVKI